ncbi:hypothetical protein VTJ83DRAFT_5966 [Remersonia thermophila]|uniref:Uncharacterized protein n=1 Tax=Remersonia thermophila TaxID=72144 RepID=A0ABR4D9B5_9PEZI
MGLRDRLRRSRGPDGDGTPPPPPVTFIRSDTHGAEVIRPPSLDDHPIPGYDGFLSPSDPRADTKQRHSLDVFRSGNRSGRSASTSSNSPGRESTAKRLSQRLHLSRSPSSSDNVPRNLPDIVLPEGTPDDDPEVAADRESQWEKRATLLAKENEKRRSRPPTPVHAAAAPPQLPHINLADDHGRGYGAADPSHRSPSPARVVSSKAIDEDIQQAIRLHESGELEKSTALFARLADPKGANNPLSQVLYGLALRHGWGCEPDPARAVSYLSAAAANAAEVEQLALQAGLKKGGAAKGELVLAIFELANCFRHGWGIPKDPIAAKQYYETAANLGDTDAMNEVAWCYLEGFGCKKDKFAAAKYYRLAEKNGNKIIGNSWIWKEKYDPDKAGKK